MTINFEINLLSLKIVFLSLKISMSEYFKNYWV